MALRSRAHRPAPPVIREPAIEVQVPVEEAPAPVVSALTPPPKDIRLGVIAGRVGDVLARPVGEGIVLGERSVYEIGRTSAAGGGMVLDESVRRLLSVYESRITELESLVQVLKGMVECLDEVSDAYYGRFQTLDEERLLEEDAMNQMHFRINDLEVAGVTTGQRLQALEDRA
ncbi:hypothetical protein L1987_45658 [Smallanthus sonchifolius]|uniref:Uncharacterized protein n=1 Tax=Smallanthus sonchifolius TaxID=185202 RepID=A0ACB9FYK0_9ASTR|nr:hypothetical protein L1987_45658 [Smallanthus sonchifolius]